MKNYFRDGGLLVSIIALIAATVATSAFVFTHSADIFWILAPIIVLASGFVILKYIHISRKNTQYFSFIEEQINQQSKLSFQNLPLGVVVVDTLRKIVWYNHGK